MTNLKLTTRTLNTLNILAVLFIFAFTANTAFAQKVDTTTTYPLGITNTAAGLTIKSEAGGISNFVLLNKDQYILGGYQGRKYPGDVYEGGFLNSNGQFFMKHTTGHGTSIMSPVNGTPKVHMSIFNTGKVRIGGPIAAPNTRAATYKLSVQNGILTKEVNVTDFVEIGKSGLSSNVGADQYKLFVETGILTEKVKVAGLTTSDWADYVFEEDYEMLPIDELEDYVTENKHLPNVPSAEEVAENGLDLAKTDATLLEKIEESYLYIIELNKKLDALEAENNNLKADVKVLQSSQK